MENPTIYQDLIYELKEATINMDKYVSVNLNKSLDEISANLESKNTNLVFLGDRNAGKTTMINSIIATVTNNYKNDILPASKSENTYYPTVIQNSKDDFYHLTVKDSGEAFYKKYSNPEDLKIKLEELDNSSLTQLKMISEYSVETDEEKLKDLDKKINKRVVYIDIPNFHNKIKLVDTPGVSCSLIADRLLNFLNDNCMICVFIFLRSFPETNMTNQNIHKFFNSFRKIYSNSIFCVCLTKYDFLFKHCLKKSKYYKPETNSKKLDEKNRKAEKFIENINYFKKELEKYAGDTNEKQFILKIFLLNNKHVFNENVEKNIYSRKQMKNFVSNLETIIKEKSEIIKTSYLISLMKKKLIDLNQEISHSFRFTVEEKLKISLTCKVIKARFSGKLKEWTQNFCEGGLIKFKARYAVKLSKIKTSFELNDSTLFRDKVYLNRKSYMKDQLNQLSNEFTQILQNDFEELWLLSYTKLVNELPKEIIEKFKQILIERGEYDESMKGGSLVSAIVLSVLNFVNATAAGMLARIIALEIAGSLFGVVGLIVVSFLSSIMAIFSIRNYIGGWSRMGCYEDIVEAFYEGSKNNIHEICAKVESNFNETLKSFEYNCIQLKNSNNHILSMLDILKKYNQKKIIDPKNTIDELYKNSLDEFEETPEIKSILTKILIENKTSNKNN